MYRQGDHRAPGHQYQYPAGSDTHSSNRTQLPSMYGIDPSLQRSPKMPQEAARPSPAHQLMTTEHHALSTRSSPSMNPESHSQAAKGGFTPTDRSLPTRDVTSQNLPDVFVSFILYCNPNFPLDVDVSTLRSNFQSPPRSDNKDFDTFRLFELIKQFEAKEIKTWAQLALDLGVEAPDTAKGQSVQKVQQYSVRLKRWMRATHIDAFFEYLLGKQHSYFLEIPYPDDPYPPGGRDGVLAEEDLAIRALDPSFRPKRGRRRNSEAEHDDRSESGSAAKHARLTERVPRSAMPLSAAPLSAYPDGFQDPWDAAAMITPGGVAPWIGRTSATPLSAAPTSNPNPLRWQFDSRTQTPVSPHSLNALPGHLSAHVDTDLDSAVTPTTRRRRRHGPAVSSAWPSANAPGSKPRGRPPANRNIQDGPFGTFPADPVNEKPGARILTPVSGDPERSVGQDAAILSTEPPMFRSQGDGGGRPGRLSLQVPQRTGAPVRLATPPRVFVHGEIDERPNSTAIAPADLPRTDQPAPGGGRIRTMGDFRMHIPDREMPGFAFEVLRRVLASDLLRAELVGRTRRLSGDEAHRLADAVLDRLGVPRADTTGPRDDIARLTAASWLGIGDQLNVPLGPAVGHSKRLRVTRFRTTADGYEELLSRDTQRGNRGGEGEEGDDDEGGTIREVFDLSWVVGLGSCTGRFEMKDLTLAAEPGSAAALPQPSEDLHDFFIRKGLEAARSLDRDGWAERHMHEVARTATAAATTANTQGGAHARPREDNIDWKARCKALEFAAKIAKGEMDRFRNRTLEAVLDAIM